MRGKEVEPKMKPMMTPTAKNGQFCAGAIQDVKYDILPPIMAPILTKIPMLASTPFFMIFVPRYHDIHLSAFEGPCWPGIGATGGIVKEDYNTREI